MSTKKAQHAIEILERIKDFYGFKTDAELQTFLGLSQSTFASRKKRGTMDVLSIISKCNDINPNWLLTGNGTKRREHEKDVCLVLEHHQLYGDDETKAILDRVLAMDAARKTELLRYIRMQEMLDGYMKQQGKE